MKRILAALLLAVAMPALALAEIVMTELNDGESRLVVFEAQPGVLDTQPGKQPATDPVQMMIGMQIGVRFEQDAAKTAASRAGASVRQTGSLWQDGKVASMGLSWQGGQADGRVGSCARGLTVSLETGMEIYLDELFSDYEGALAAMEAIIADDVLENMSDYMEYADLLPMPTDSYYFDELGLTVCWPEDRYCYFSGESGTVTFYWHEIEAYIGEESPVYALSRIQPVDVSGLRTALAHGTFDAYVDIGPDATLGDAARDYALGDPDYTTDALVYPLERMRGFALEIPKYAETDEEDTVISAVRASRISFCGLTTGRTVPEDLYAIFGEPDATQIFDEEAAQDALLEPGESLYFVELGKPVLQAHFDESGVLSCVILRNAMPESL